LFLISFLPFLPTPTRPKKKQKEGRVKMGLEKKMVLGKGTTRGRKERTRQKKTQIQSSVS